VPVVKITFSGVALVAANLVPIAGVAFYGWKAEQVFILFWAENFVIGAWNVLRILAAQPPGWRERSFAGRAWRKLALAAFFAPAFCIVNLAYGVVLATLVYRDPAIGWEGVERMVAGLFVSRETLLALAGFVASHGVSFAANFIGGGEYRTLPPVRLHHRPYRRIVITHVLMFPTALIYSTTGLELGPVLVFAVLKAVFDLAIHLQDHREKPGDGPPRPWQTA
jgi:hypothetical protein